jgi:hypothetical protein
VSGTLPGTLTFDNGTALNDYFEGFTFGTVLKFDVSLYGPALSSPDGTSTSGSSFGFSMFSDLGTTPALTSDLVDGIALSVNVNLDGSTTLTNSSSQTSVEAAGVAVPEPGGFAELMLLLLAMIFLGYIRLKWTAASGNEETDHPRRSAALRRGPQPVHAHHAKTRAR